MAYEIIVCGHLTLDMLPDIQMLTSNHLIQAGKLFEIGTMGMSTGGAVSNTGLALHKLGSQVGLMGLVGDDWIGQVIRDFLSQHHPSLIEHIRIIPSASSAYTIVLEPHNHDRTLLTHTGTNHLFGFDMLDFDIIEQASIFHLGYPTLLPRLYQDDGAELETIFQQAKKAGCITSMDMTLPDADHASGQVDWNRILARVLPHVDIFIPSIEEITFMCRRADYDRWQGDIINQVNEEYLSTLADDILAMGCAVVGFKLGKRGLFLKTTSDSSRLSSPDDWCNQQLWQPAFKVDVVGTTGAGDATYAGFLSAFQRGLSPAECARIACAVGASNVEALDPTSGVRSWDETHQRIQAGWQTY